MTKKQILAKKQEALETFTKKLFKSKEGAFVDKVVVYGSFAQGQVDKESDIDIMVFARRPRKVEEKVEEIAFEVMLNKGEYIEPFVYRQQELQKPSSYFVYSALKRGKELNYYASAKRK